MRLLRGTGQLVLWLLCLGVGIGFVGRIHPAGDSLSLLRLPLGLLCLLALVWPTNWPLRATLLVSGFAAVLTTIPPLFLRQSDGDLLIYTKNLWYRNPELPALAADIRTSGAEVVTLQEVSHRNDTLLAQLARDFPYQHLCRFSGWSGIAVLSKHPIVDKQCS